MPRPLVSFALPMYNGAKTIEETIRSLQAQTITDWEAVIVNDGSTDEGPQLVEQLARNDPRLRLIHRENGGRAKARNTGLDAANGQYIALMDADDLLLPDGLRILIEAAESSGLRAAAGQIRYTGPAGDDLGYSLSPDGSLKEIGLNEWLETSGFQINAQVIHRDLLGSTRKREHVPIYEDMDLFLLLADKGVRWTIVPQVVATYRLHHNDRSFPKFFEYYQWYARILNEAYERARVSGWAARGVDLSRERQERVLAAATWQFAHLLIHQDQTPRKDMMAQIIACTRPGRPPIDPFEAAAIAYTHAPMAEEKPLSTWTTDPARYLRSISLWWQRCVDEGWTAPSFLDKARAHLINRVSGFTPQRVADQMADAVSPNDTIVLAGLGQNGLLVARSLAQRGMRFWVRDDAMTAAVAAEKLTGSHARWLDPSETLPPQATVLMSVADDARFLSSFAAARRTVRWSDTLQRVREELASPYERLFAASAA